MRNRKKELPRPEHIINEEVDIQKIQTHYDGMQRICFQHHIFSIVFSVDKTLFALVSGALTGLSASVLAGFLNFSDCTAEQMQLHIMQFVLTLIFNGAVVLFTAKVIQIQDSGMSFVPPSVLRLTYKEIRSAQYNIEYENCMQSVRYLETLYLVSVISGILALISLLGGYSFLKEIKEIIEWLECLAEKLMKW